MSKRLWISPRLEKRLSYCGLRRWMHDELLWACPEPLEAMFKGLKNVDAIWIEIRDGQTRDENGVEVRIMREVGMAPDRNPSWQYWNARMEGWAFMFGSLRNALEKVFGPKPGKRTVWVRIWHET